MSVYAWSAASSAATVGLGTAGVAAESAAGSVELPQPAARRSTAAHPTAVVRRPALEALISSPLFHPF
ncbi:hypothetical protein GCM10027294_19130 [Marinactinospora endophytica]